MWSFIISGIFAFTFCITNCQGQTVGAMALNALVSQSTIEENGNDVTVQINEKAVSHFKQTFKDAMDERWTVGQDCYRVSFEKESVKYIVDYYLNGRQRNIIRIYDESHLPADIRLAVKTAFIDSEIILINELQFGKILAYFIKIRQDGLSKTIKAMDGQIEIVEEFNEQ